MSSKLAEWKAIAHQAWSDLKAKLAALFDAVVSKFKDIAPETVEGKAQDILKQREAIYDKAERVVAETQKMTDNINDGIKATESDRVKGIFTTELGFIVKINKMALSVIQQEDATTAKIVSA
jgi:hypothetical protein